MLIELVELTTSDIPLLDNLAQLYLYDFSEFESSDVGTNGRFGGWIDWNKFFSEGTHRVYVIKVDGAIAGFTSICKDSTAYRNEQEKVWWIDEFFVMRKFRRRGVGKHVAMTLFERFPGTWEVGQVRANIGARDFWRRVIGAFTGGDFVEIDFDDDRWTGSVQYFESGTSP